MMLDIDSLPKPNDAFVWVQAVGGPALVCRPLSTASTHVFTTCHWTLGSAGADVEKETAWHAVAHAVEVDASRLVRARQVHGAAVLVAPPLPIDRPQADIVVVAGPGLAAAVQSADCVPLLLADRRTGAVAAAHAGWRGLAAGVPAESVSALIRLYGTDVSDLHVAIGPSIGACCYQVGPDVLQAFVARGFDPERLATYFRSVSPNAPGNPSCEASSGPRMDRWFLDTWRVAREGLEASGVPPDQIYVADLCTASHPRVFCSYRRDGVAAGRLAAAIKSGRAGP